MAMRIRDYTPSVRAAGKDQNMAERNQGIAAELSEIKVPPTPKGVAPFRKSYQCRVGMQSHHWGFRNDEPTPDLVHGEANKYISSAEECLKAAASNKGLSALSAENAEKKYLRSRKEPLGKSAEPTCALPEKTQMDNFFFGIASSISECAKSVIYDGGEQAEIPNPNIVAPGQQKTRKYDWARVGIDPTRVRFGRASSADPLTTKELCQPTNATKLLPKIVQSHCAVANPQQGQCKNLGFGSRQETKDHVYGFTYRNRNAMGTRLLIGGSGLVPEADDPSIGRPVCRSVTLRNLRKKDTDARGPDVGRVFGTPAVRLDLPKPKYRKVMSLNNYGDEPTGGSLLYPNPHAVNEEAFLEQLSVDQMRDLLGKSGCPGATPEQVEQAIQTVFKGKGPEGKADILSVNQVLDSYNA